MPRISLKPGFVKCDSANVPKVDMWMVTNFFLSSDFISAEVRGGKITRAARESYGDSAIGFVEINRKNGVCTVIAKVTPEHRVTSTSYNVEVEIDENKNTINKVICKDCAASLGGCKHGIALMMWLHRRSEEPSPTEVTCYWKKARLSEIGSSLKYIKAKDMGRKSAQQLQPDVLPTIMNAIINVAITSKINCVLANHLTPLTDVQKLSLNYLSDLYKESYSSRNATDFLNFCERNMNTEICKKASEMTSDQNKCNLWYELRYGRCTASNVYQASRCKVEDGGSLKEILLGACKLHDTEPMKRGRLLESKVLKVIQKDFKEKIVQPGVILNPKYPFFGASPDGVTSESVIEIKCPSSEDARVRYISKNGVIAPKYLAQIRLQMLFAEKQKGLFCVASPSFEKDRIVQKIVVCYDKKFCTKMMSDSLLFWNRCIFPVLME